MKNKWRKRFGYVCLLLIGSLISGNVGRVFAEAASEQEVNSGEINEDTVIVGGMPIGIYMKTEGVLVLSTQELENCDGDICEPAKNLVKSGDYIVEVNQTEITDKESLIEAVEQLQTEEVILKLQRNNETIEVRMKAVETEAEEYKLGIWVRDSIQGLGTITYLTSNSEFGALGHGIHDIDISTLIDVSEGSLYKTNIVSITKGEDGSPGSMEGVIVYNNTNKVGTIIKNTEVGIYGVVENVDAIFTEQNAVETASADEIEKGKATIYCSLGDNIEEYEVEILDIDLNSSEVNKGITIQVTDEELLEKTGGIIQGMSGSPILQDGKLVGAVTHVFVNDPTKGYGIIIENMLDAAE